MLSIDVFNVRLLEAENTGVVTAGSVFHHIKVGHASIHVPPLARGGVNPEKDIVVMPRMHYAGIVPLCRRAIPYKWFVFGIVGARHGDIDDVRYGHGAYGYVVLAKLLTFYF